MIIGAMAMEKEGHPFSPPPTIMEDESVRRQYQSLPMLFIYHEVIGITHTHTHTQEVIEDLHGDPEENSSHYMAVLIEALSILGKVEETLDVSVLSKLMYCLFLFHAFRDYIGTCLPCLFYRP